MQIDFDPGSLTQTTTGSIVAKVHFEFWTTQFPDSSWSDFVVVLSDWWMQATTALRGRAGGSAQLRFMDGPYRVEARLEAKAHVVRLRCLRDNAHPQVLYDTTVEFDELNRAVQTFARQVWSACIRKGLESSDIEALGRWFGPDEEVHDGIREGVAWI